MKRKILIALAAMTAAFCLVCGLAACGGKDDQGGNQGNQGSNQGNQGGQEPPAHTTHVYDKKVTEEKYLKSEATCTKNAEYYFSCECGEKGSETFSYGDLADHVYKTYTPDDNATCVKNGTETAKCKNCTKTDTREIENSKTAHTYDKKVVDSDYLKSEATCLKKAEYFYSCECGKKGDTAFESGDLAAHNLTHTPKTEAACTAEGVREHWSCSVCEKKFSDENGANVITNTTIPATGHKSWENNVCSGCGFDAGGTKELYYKLSNNGKYYSVHKSSISESHIVIPATYNGKPVTQIADMAFQYQPIIKITIPDSVTYIGSNAFSGCTSLTEAIINVKDVPYNAFEGCSLLKDLTLGDNVESIGDSAFKDCASLKNVVLPDGLTRIGRTAFRNCTSLESVNIPATVKDIGEWAFDNCNSLSEIKFEGSIADWCETEGISNLDKSSTVIGNQKLSEMTEITIPDGVTKIVSRAFSDLTALESVSIGKDVEFIGSFAFGGCPSLKNIDIPDGVTEMGSSVFSECTSLEKIVIPAKVKVIGEWTLLGCTSLTSVTLPDGLTEIGENAFADCSSIEEIKFEGDIEGWCKVNGLDKFDGLMGNGRKLFIDGKEIKGNLIIPAEVETIAGGAFYGLAALESVEIASGVTEIGSMAFYGCENITEIKLPDGLTEMGWGAFSGCVSLESITFGGTKEQWEQMGQSVNCTVHCTNGDIVIDE